MATDAAASGKKGGSTLSPVAKGVAVGTFLVALLSAGLLVGFLTNGEGGGGGDASPNAVAPDEVPEGATGGVVDDATPSVADDAPPGAAMPEKAGEAGSPEDDDAFCAAFGPPCARLNIKVAYGDRYEHRGTSYELTRLGGIDGGGDGWAEDEEEEGQDQEEEVIASYVPAEWTFDHSEALCLESGAYRFTFRDDNKNGIRGWTGDGYYEVESYGETLARGSEWFGPAEVTRFAIDVDAEGRRDMAEAIVATQATTEEEATTSGEVGADDASSPRGRAVRWIACRDQVSAGLFRRAKNSTSGMGDLGDVGGAQVLRRYALATFYYATSEGGGWDDDLGFLNEDEHECAWHANVTRGDGTAELAGVVCMGPDGEVLLDEEEGTIGSMMLTVRAPNNLVGTIPPELGRVPGLTGVVLENQEGLHGTIPSSVADMEGLRTLSIDLGGPGEGA